MSSEIEKMSENLNNFSKSWSIIYFTRGKDTKWEKVVRKMVFSGVKERKGVQEGKERGAGGKGKERIYFSIF